MQAVFIYVKEISVLNKTTFIVCLSVSSCVQVHEYTHGIEHINLYMYVHMNELLYMCVVV